VGTTLKKKSKTGFTSSQVRTSYWVKSYQEQVDLVLLTLIILSTLQCIKG